MDKDDDGGQERLQKVEVGPVLEPFDGWGGWLRGSKGSDFFFASPPGPRAVGILGDFSQKLQEVFFEALGMFPVDPKAHEVFRLPLGMFSVDLEAHADFPLPSRQGLVGLWPHLSENAGGFLTKVGGIQPPAWPIQSSGVPLEKPMRLWECFQWIHKEGRGLRP